MGLGHFMDNSQNSQMLRRDTIKKEALTDKGFTLLNVTPFLLGSLR